MKRRILKILPILMVIGVVVSGCFNNDTPEKGTSLKAASKSTVKDGITVNRTIMKVDKLTCGSCLRAISQKLSTIDGISGMGADLSRGLVAVDHLKTLESDKVAEAITSIGYPAKVLVKTQNSQRRHFFDMHASRIGESAAVKGQVFESGQVYQVLQILISHILAPEIYFLQRSDSADMAQAAISYPAFSTSYITYVKSFK